jgi:Cu(I)/Ag(I) efflux system protein CusF
MKQVSRIIAATAIALAGSAYAQSHQGMGNMKMDNMDMNDRDMSGMKMDQKPSAATLTSGEVKAVNKDKNSITLKHGPIKSASVQMPAMTMAFPVKDAAMLKNIKTGDKVQFTVENVKGTATVTVLEPKK